MSESLDGASVGGGRKNNRGSTVVEAFEAANTLKWVVEIFWLVLLVYLFDPTDGQIVASSQMVHEQKGQATYSTLNNRWATGTTSNRQQRRTTRNNASLAG